MRAGVVSRIAIASLVLAIALGSGFALLVHELQALRASGRAVTQSRNANAAADALERLVIDLETGVRGFVMTGQPRFLAPWVAARAAIPAQAERLAASVDNPQQARHAHKLSADINSYINDFTVPLVAAVRRNRTSGLSVAVTAEGKRRVDALRAEFDRFRTAELARIAARQQRDERNASRVVTLAAIALGVSVVFILLRSGYLLRTIAVPLRDAAAMADVIASGDLAVRLPETGTGEVAGLQRAFNRMASSFEASRDELQRLADEQSALRRVATLVGHGAPPAEVFTAVAKEAGELLSADLALFGRYDVGPSATGVVGWSRTGDPVALGARVKLGGRNVTTLVFESGRPARLDTYADASGPLASFAAGEMGVRSTVGAPIRVEGRLWGVMIVAARREVPHPPDTEERLANFTELAATAIANSQAREELRAIADEQAALRRVATLVARGVPPAEMFNAVTSETRRVLELDACGLMRFDTDGSTTLLAADSTLPLAGAVGERLALDPGTTAARVRRTGRPARVAAYDDNAGPMSQRLRSLGHGGAVAAPVVVKGGVWGVIVATWAAARVIPAGDEERLVQFTELVATAIANTQAQTELTASRARIVTSADDTRRRIERSLHDGAQQRLVTVAVQLRAARAAVPPDHGQLAAKLEIVAAGIDAALDEVREIARGIHPAILLKGGLGPAVRALARRSTVPVELDLRLPDRLPEPVEIAAYYVASEAVTNAAKHAAATRVAVEVTADERVLRVNVRDDGVGGASFAGGLGLVGLKDRVHALGGRISLRSKPGHGTSLSAELPLVDEAVTTAN